MPIGSIEHEIHDAYGGLAKAAAMARYCHGHYLDGLTAGAAGRSAAGRSAAGRFSSGIAASPAEIEALLTALTGQVVEVTQTRLTNVYDSVEAYNAGTTGATIPYHVLVLAGFPAGVGDRAAELLSRLARNGPRAGLY